MGFRREEKTWNETREWIVRRMRISNKREIYETISANDCCTKQILEAMATHKIPQDSMSYPTYLVSLCFFMYLAAQFPQGRLPSHFVFRARHRSQLAQRVTVGFFSSPFLSSTFLQMASLLAISSISVPSPMLMLGMSKESLSFTKTIRRVFLGTCFSGGTQDDWDLIPELWFLCLEYSVRLVIGVSPIGQIIILSVLPPYTYNKPGKLAISYGKNTQKTPVPTTMARNLGTTRK